MDATSKIADRDLREFARSGSLSPRRVLLEVEGPEPQIKGRAGSITVPQPSVAEKQQEEGAVEATSSLLQAMNVKGRFLPSARAFLVDVTADQLRRLVEAPSVRSAIANRQFDVLA